MKKVRTLITTATLASVLLLGSTFANAGIIVAGYADKQPTADPCQTSTSRTSKDGKSDSGIIVADATGIIVAGFTGIIVTDFTGIIVAGATSEPVNCGIIVAG
jgi:hypothetical protein